MVVFSPVLQDSGFLLKNTLLISFQKTPKKKKCGVSRLKDGEKWPWKSGELCRKRGLD